LFTIALPNKMPYFIIGHKFIAYCIYVLLKNNGMKMRLKNAVPMAGSNQSISL